MASGLVSSSVCGTQNIRSGAISWLPVLFRRYSIRTQLLLALVCLWTIGCLIGGAVTILQARKSTRIEVSAAMNLAEGLVRDAIPFVEMAASPSEALISIPNQVGAVRHIRISSKGTSDLPVESTPQKGSAVQQKLVDVGSPAPGWFAVLIAPPPETRTIPVTSNGQELGSIMLSSASSDEIAEAWENATQLAKAAVLLGIASIVILHLLFGRVLAPLRSLAAGLLDLGRSDYDVRLPLPQARDLAVIAESFNGLAADLASMKAENRRLSQRLITAQDDERRQTALDLHDEVGPYLFGLKATTTSLANGLSGTPLEGRAREMLTMVEGLQSINRNILNRLRPMALGQVPFSELLSALVVERAALQPGISFKLSADGLLSSYGESIDLTLYRCLQEGLTNVIRHANAHQCSVAVMHGIDENRSADRPASVILTIADDGQGIDHSVSRGSGIQGMQERAQALGGECRLESMPGQGTILRVEIPIPDVTVKTPRRRATL
jgi:two-component system, NarL family, sensor histidine kinase UhpB